MPASRGKKRRSDGSNASTEEQHASEMATQAIPTKSGSPDVQPSPLKKRKVGITLAQKQALVDNLQLEITERARKLRANYNIHAQSLRTRVEIRVNRIPLSLRKVKMGDLVLKYSKEPQQKTAAVSSASKPRPVPANDPPTRAQAQPVAPLAPASRPPKRTSDVLTYGDKENEFDQLEILKKKPRPVPSVETIRDPSQVLSPTSSNTRVVPRDRADISPGKSQIARPVSPTKPGGATNLLSSMVEKARSTRTASTIRKATNASTASSSNGSSAAGSGTTAGARTGKGAPVTAPAPSRSATARAARRASGVSESSDGSTSTVVRKPTATRGTAPKPAATGTAPRKTVMGTIKRGVAGATASKKAAGAKTGTGTTGRVLRKRT